MGPVRGCDVLYKLSGAPEEFIHGPLSEDIQVRLEREKLSVRKHIFIINRFIFFSYFTLTGLMDIFLNNL